MKKILFLIIFTNLLGVGQNLDNSKLLIKYDNIDDDTTSLRGILTDPSILNCTNDTIQSYSNSSFMYKVFNTKDSIWETIGGLGSEIMFDYCKIANLKINLKEDFNLKNEVLDKNERSYLIEHNRRSRSLNKRQKYPPGNKEFIMGWTYRSLHDYFDSLSKNDTVIKMKVIFRKPFGENSYTEAEREFYTTNLEFNYDIERTRLFDKYVDSCQKVSKVKENDSFKYRCFVNATTLNFFKKYQNSKIYRFRSYYMFIYFDSQLVRKYAKSQKDSLQLKKMIQKLIFFDKNLPKMIATINKPRMMKSNFNDIYNSQFLFYDNYEMQVKIGLQILKYYKVLSLKLRKLIPELISRMDELIEFDKKRGFYPNGKIWLFDRRIEEYALKISKD